MAHGKPINRLHPGISNLTTEEIKKFDALQSQKLRVGGQFTDQGLKDQLSQLQEKIRDIARKLGAGYQPLTDEQD